MSCDPMEVSQTMRAFMAITPPPSLQSAIVTIQRDFQEQGMPWRWVKPENVHLTLKFLGNTSPDMIAPLVQAMERAVEGQKAFPLSARSLGCFPNLSRPRVLWMGLEDLQDALAPLHTRLEIALASLNISPENRPFHPHLTLARTQQRMARGKLITFLQAYNNRQFGEISVEQIHLFQSQLHRNGAVYTILQSVTLPS